MKDIDKIVGELKKSIIYKNCLFGAMTTQYKKPDKSPVDCLNEDVIKLANSILAELKDNDRLKNDHAIFVETLADRIDELKKENEGLKTTIAGLLNEMAKHIRRFSRAESEVKKLEKIFKEKLEEDLNKETHKDTYKGVN